jgi:hypothetical protein
LRTVFWVPNYRTLFSANHDFIECFCKGIFGYPKAGLGITIRPNS